MQTNADFLMEVIESFVAGYVGDTALQKKNVSLEIFSYDFFL